MDKYKLNLEKTVLFSLEIPRNLSVHVRVNDACELINNLLRDYKADSLMITKENLQEFSEKYSKFSIETSDGFLLESKVTESYVELICTQYAYSIKEARESICERID